MEGYFINTIKTMKLFIFVFSLVLLTGCASFRPESLMPAQTAAVFEARTLTSPGLKKFLEKNLSNEISPWPPKFWDFTMLTLAAFYYNPDLDVARAKWGVTEAGITTAGARPNPSVSFLDQHHSKYAGGLSPWTLGAGLDIPVETAGKRGYRIQSIIRGKTRI